MVQYRTMKPEDRSDLKQRQRQADRLIIHGEFDQAISVYFDIIRRYKTDTSVCEKAYLDLGDIHLLLMELDLAENYFKLALGYGPAKTHIHYLLGFTYSLTHQWDKAITEFRFCIQQDPARFEYAYALGWALYEAWNRSAAVECLMSSRHLKSSEADIAGLGSHLFFCGDMTGIMRYARLAVKVAPENRYMKWMLKEMKDLHQMARTLSPPFGRN
jgi:tetratricopeptide (TPR) repeat protein